MELGFITTEFNSEIEVVKYFTSLELLKNRVNEILVVRRTQFLLKNYLAFLRVNFSFFTSLFVWQKYLIIKNGWFVSFKKEQLGSFFSKVKKSSFLEINFSNSFFENLFLKILVFWWINFNLNCNIENLVVVYYFIREKRIVYESSLFMIRENLIFFKRQQKIIFVYFNKISQFLCRYGGQYFQIFLLSKIRWVDFDFIHFLVLNKC